MDATDAIAALAALAHPTRLDAFRLLVGSEPGGKPAGALAAALKVPQNTMSAHLASLARAGLVTGERRGRQVLYRAAVDRLGALVGFLVNDCCGGRPQTCTALAGELGSCSR